MDKIIPLFIDRAMPEWFSAVFMLCILSASMSTLSAQFHTMGASFGADIFPKLGHRKNANSTMGVRIGVLCSILVSYIIWYTLSAGGIARGTALFMGSCAATFLPAYFCSLFWKKATKEGALASLWTGALASLFAMLFLHKAEAGAVVLCAVSFSAAGYGSVCIALQPADQSRKPQVSIRIIKRAGDILPLGAGISCRTQKPMTTETQGGVIMKIAIGMVVRNLLSASPLTEFLDNAEKYGHPIDRVIVAYSHQLAPEAAAVLQSRTKLSLIRLQEFGRTYLILKAIGVPYASLRELLFCPLIDTHGLIPYGFNRNQVLMEAMFTEADVLIFVDSDVLPSVLRRMPDGSVRPCEVDFVGAHLGGMAMGADITSSDYSGYNILPPASFDGMKDLLWGLHKETMTDFWQNSEAHRGLVIQEAQNAEPQPTTKVLGGNLGIRMSALTTLPPFFSPYYFYNRTPLLARGEETLMGMAASQSHIRCLDIQTPIFHDTYGDYPKVPDLRNDSRVRDRLYYACTGWIGRNVFFRWKTGHTPSEFTQRNRQLAAGAKALARYTNDRRFLYLPDIQSAAESWLPDMIGQYQKSKEAWNELTERWFGR